MDDELTSPGTEQADAPPEPPRVLSRPIYCKQCDYDLRAASAGRCPECGLPFDRLRPHTFAFRTRAQDRGRLVGFIALTAGIFATFAAGFWLGFGWLVGLTAAVVGIVFLGLAACSIHTSGRMLERHGRRRSLREFHWPGRRRW